ncbi:MAG: YeeE/YedE family protein [Rhodospirillales bacterium]|nr:YeeE/YedE family protein [Rhodospirillales bacterium]
MNLEGLYNLFGEGGAAAICGLAIGLMYGALAQRSQFCMRAAVLEYTRGTVGPKFAVWLLGFGVAVTGTQMLIASGSLDVSESRQLAAQGSLSGAVIGGLLFGAGMVLARGCASRLLVLSATGNLRALISGLILTIVAQASFRGGLSPLREWLSGLWTIGGDVSRDLHIILGVGGIESSLFGTGFIILALVLAVRNRIGGFRMAGAIGIGAIIPLGWFLTYSIASQSFDPISVKSISFIGPSADTLMGIINQPTLPPVFDLGLIPGVFAGSFVASALSRDFKFQCFSIENSPMPRYIIGAVLMGFGGMLAGGCAVGAGMTGTAVFSLTAWIALVSMWAGGVITDSLVDRRREKDAESVPVNMTETAQ